MVNEVTDVEMKPADEVSAATPTEEKKDPDLLTIEGNQV